jgi:alkaline phosphatase D
MRRLGRLRSVVTVSLIWAAAGVARADDFVANFAKVHDRIWVGPELWANPMEDWRVHDGRLECLSGGPNRNVHVLTRQLGKQPGTLIMSVRLGRLDRGTVKGSAGFRIGIQDEIEDYRARLIYGQGLDAGVTTVGELFIGTVVSKPGVVRPEQLAKGIELRLIAANGNKGYELMLLAFERGWDKAFASVSASNIPADRLYGNLALVNNFPDKLPGPKAKKKKGIPESQSARFWFNQWSVIGDKAELHEKRAFGPVLWSTYTLSRGVLKLTAQMPPLGDKDTQTVSLQTRSDKGWRTIAQAKIDPLSRTATFRVPNWDDRQDVPYRLLYLLATKMRDVGGGKVAGLAEETSYTGTIRKDPVHKDTLVLAGLSCNADYCFPNREIVRNLKHQDPDVLFFAGDQIYEYVGGYPLIRQPVDRACLNYLRKWYLFGMAFGDLMRDRPTVCIPDDHDVYQGNIWGNGGNPISLADHAKGGYAMHRDFVEAVHRTQTSNLPDPFDPMPIKQGISVYYTDMVYGRIGFAVIADRMFKSGPEGTVATWPGRPDHLKDPKVDVKTLDKPGLQFLGERQEKFLRHWAADWKGVDMKCVLSQTIFCNLANYHGAQQEYLIADLDSGGWPQSARNRALDLMRRGFALHVAGDQHLASLVHYGIAEPGDANFSFCVPAVANFYPRRWIPDKEGRPAKNRPAPALPHTGDYQDGLGNPIRVLAVANPEDKYRPGRLPSLHDKASGYGIVRFHRKDQTITMECYRLLADVTKPRKDDQFPGWPRTIKMTDNYGRKPAGHLPTLEVKGMTDPVVQVIDEAKDEVVYTLRIKGDGFRPPVFSSARYTVRVGELGTERTAVVRGVSPAVNAEAVLKVRVP